MSASNVQRFLDDDGRAKQWPTKHKDKVLVLAYLATKFDVAAHYTEVEVNEILKAWHTFGDWPLLRRELYERGFLDRNRDGSDYHINVPGPAAAGAGTERGAALIVWMIIGALALAGIGYAAYSAMRPKTAAPSAAATPALSSGGAGLTKYASAAEPGLSFTFPTTWTIKNSSTVTPARTDGLQLTSPAGTVVGWQSDVQGLGGGCPAERPVKYIRRVDPVAGAKGLYIEEVGDTAGQTTSLGIVGAVAGAAPKVGPTDCLAYTIFRSFTRMTGGSPVTMALETTGPVVPADIPAVRQILGSLVY